MSKYGNTEKIYINEIIRVTYKCNWSCKFCNVLKTNNFWENDVSDIEIIHQILNLVRKYTTKERWNLILSFSGWEPTLSKNLTNYIRLAKAIWIYTVEIQTNGTKLFKEKEYIFDLIEAWLDEIFLAQHSWDVLVNKELWSYYRIEDFIDWIKYIKENKIHKKISIYLNIVVTSINIFFLYNYIEFLLRVGFIDLIPLQIQNDHEKNTRKISFGFVQPNGYAEINKELVLLKYTEAEIQEIDKIIRLCEKNHILPDLHFVCPPLCILHYPKYNLEYARLKKLERDSISWNIYKSNLESYKFLWKEKRKFDQCNACNYNKYCLGFYKNWINFVWENYAIQKVLDFTNK